MKIPARIVTIVRPLLVSSAVLVCVSASLAQTGTHDAKQENFLKIETSIGNFHET
jgi:hypothetical protein